MTSTYNYRDFHCILRWFFVVGMLPLLCADESHAEVAMPSIFGDGMVLQRELPVPVWGTAGAGEAVTVTFAGQSVSTNADPDGIWQITLKPLTTSSTGRTLVVSGSNKLEFKDVLVGEVWLCSGQSNMAGTFNKNKGRVLDPEILKTDLSRLRFNGRNGWDKVSEQSLSRLSMVAFYFGHELYEELDIPIGLITRYNSGTPIQAWMPEDAADQIRVDLGIEPNWRDPDNKPQRQPGVQFDSKIAPVIPFSIRGVIWYQGERNAKSETACEYDSLLAFHIDTWRQRWAAAAELEKREFPFYYVQVPTQESPVTGEWPWLRDRMRRALDITRNTGMAICYDYGPSLHPNNKQPFGERLALIALAKNYGRDEIVYSGPLVDEITFKDSKATLTFTHTGGGLRSKTGGKQLKFFEIAGKDGKYEQADAWIEGDTVIVHSEKVDAPQYVRYLFRKPSPDPEISLLNEAGLPASSFMTDDFMPKRTGGLKPSEVRRAKRGPPESQQEKDR
ncbi:MAG: sialate O-acetylesterase [Planctomycetota bacterium]